MRAGVETRSLSRLTRDWSRRDEGLGSDSTRRCAAQSHFVKRYSFFGVEEDDVGRKAGLEDEVKRQMSRRVAAPLGCVGYKAGTSASRANRR